MGPVKLRRPSELRPGERIGGLDKLTEQIRARRAALRLSQEELAYLADISRSTVKNAESGSVEIRLTVPTIVGIHLALAWAPRFPQDLSAGFEPVEVLSDHAAFAITAVLVVLREQKRLYSRLLLDYHELVDALADDSPRLPDGFSSLHEVLVKFTPPREMEQVDEELALRIGGSYPYRWSDGVLYSVPGNEPELLGDNASFAYVPSSESPPPAAVTIDRLPDAIIGKIVNSGLPRQLQQVIIEGMLKRRDQLREDMNATLSAELDTLIRATRQTMEHIASLPSGADWRKAIDKSLTDPDDRSTRRA